MKRVAVLTALMLAAACSTPQRDAAFRPLVVGDRAPAYAARTLSGDSVRVGAGKPVLLNVWATWCTSCREEMADLAALQRAYEPRGVQIVAVSVDAGNDTRVRRYAESEKLPFVVAHDASGEVQRAFQTVGVPETYLVSGDGRLLWMQRGGLHGGLGAARATLDSVTSRR
jgi:cytochrome c biogenesis protein CcmG/thiol:disulfide interchange protein DsbE